MFVRRILFHVNGADPGKFVRHGDDGVEPDEDLPAAHGAAVAEAVIQREELPSGVLGVDVLEIVKVRAGERHIRGEGVRRLAELIAVGRLVDSGRHGRIIGRTARGKVGARLREREADAWGRDALIDGDIAQEDDGLRARTSKQDVQIREVTVAQIRQDDVDLLNGALDGFPLVGIGDSDLVGSAIRRGFAGEDIGRVAGVRGGIVESGFATGRKDGLSEDRQSGQQARQQYETAGKPRA